MSAKLGDLASKTMTRYINVSVNGIIPSLFMGAGFARAIEKKEYHYLPCFLFLPVFDIFEDKKTRMPPRLGV